MSRSSFFDAAAKTRTTETIRAIESLTSAEVVVTVKPRAAHYVPTSLAGAAVCAGIAFLVMWFSPWVFDVRTMPLEVALVFVVTGIAIHSVDHVKLWSTPRSVRRRWVAAAARRAFQELGVHKTSERVGLLVFVSLLEREVLLVPDEGIPVAVLGEGWTTAEPALAAAVAAGDLDAFISTLGRLGPVLAQALPRRADDKNELCDDVA